MKFINKSLFLFFSICLFSLSSIAGGEYNLEEKKNYYLSPQFKKDWKQYCYFKTDLVSTYRREVKSLEEARKAIAVVADLPGKSKWDKLVNPAKSHLIFPGDNTLGMIYHLEYKNIKDSFFKKDTIITDYYREKISKDKFKGCILYTTSPAKFANFEYTIVKEDGKIYVERTARVVSAIVAPKFMAIKKLDSLNKKRLDEIIEVI
jgi:hypothetical protein